MKIATTRIICLLGMLCLLLSGCIFYQKYPMAKSRLTKITHLPLTYYVLDAARPKSRVWYVSEAEFSEGKMNGFLVRVSETEAEEIATVSGNRDAKSSKNDVLMYARPKYAMTLADTATVSLSYDELEKIEVFEVNHGKTVAVTLLTLLMPVTFLAALSGY